ncbi:MAG: KdsC family phosphatase [Bdellovibrionales bacterium]
MLEIAKLKNIKALVLDVDGVLTDACVQWTESGEWVRRYNVRDGVGIKLLQKKGFIIGVITGAKSRDVTERVEFLGIEHFYNGIVDKTIALDDFVEKTDLRADQIAYVGDDIYDVELFSRVGFAVTVPGAIDEALEKASYITKREGGKGAVREICDYLLKYSDGSSSV